MPLLQFQQPFQRAGVPGATAVEEGGDALGEEAHALDAPADHQETPAVVAGHVVEGETGQGCQGHH